MDYQKQGLLKQELLRELTSSMSAKPQPKTTRDWQASDHAHYMHPFTDHHDLGRKGSRIITRAEGVYIYDSDGNQILDGMAGLWCVNLGYGRQDLVDAACPNCSVRSARTASTILSLPVQDPRPSTP